MLEVKDLNIEFHDHSIPETVVYDFDLVMEEGDIVGIVSGKIGGETQLTLYDNNDKPIGSIPYSSDYFLFKS